MGSANVLEIREKDQSGTYRVIYTLEMENYVFVLHAFQKKSKSGIATPIPLVIRKSVYAASALHCLCVRLHHPTYSSWVASASALPDTNTSSLLAYSRFLNRSRYKQEMELLKRRLQDARDLYKNMIATGKKK